MDISSPSLYFRNSTWLFEESKETIWTAEENKLFENALALFDQDTPDRWFNVAAMIPGKSVNDVFKQYRELLEDVSDIEAGLIPVPGYATDYFALEWTNNHGSDGMKQFYAPGVKRSSSMHPSDLEKKKGIPWTEEEHRQFLLGLKKYGKGDWRNISRNFVTTRTPTQVASHAQKYFLRQLSGGKDKRRSSIHDITTVHIPDTKKSLSPKTEKHPSPDDHHIQQQVPQLLQQQQQSNMNQMAKALYQWAALPNQGSTTTAFDLPNSSLMMASFYETSAYEPQYGHYGTVFQGNC